MVTYHNFKSFKKQTTTLLEFGYKKNLDINKLPSRIHFIMTFKKQDIGKGLYHTMQNKQNDLYFSYIFPP